MSNRDKLYSLIKKHGKGDIPAKLIHNIGNYASVTRVLRKLKTNGIIDYKYIDKEKSYRITEINKLHDKSVRNKLSGKVKYKVLERDSFKCRACGRGTGKVELEVDHVIPIQWGGAE